MASSREHDATPWRLPEPPRPVRIWPPHATESNRIAETAERELRDARRQNETPDDAIRDMPAPPPGRSVGRPAAPAAEPADLPRSIDIEPEPQYDERAAETPDSRMIETIAEIATADVSVTQVAEASPVEVDVSQPTTPAPHANLSPGTHSETVFLEPATEARPEPARESAIAPPTVTGLAAEADDPDGISDYRPPARRLRPATYSETIRIDAIDTPIDIAADDAAHAAMVAESPDADHRDLIDAGVAETACETEQTAPAPSAIVEPPPPVAVEPPRRETAESSRPASPASPASPRTVVVSNRRIAHWAGDQVETVWRNLVHTLPAAAPRVALVTGVSPRVGATELAVALTMTASAQRPEWRVLLLELNPRRPRLSALLGVSSDHGLRDVLAGDLPIDACIDRVRWPAAQADQRAAAIDVLPAGAPSPKWGLPADDDAIANLIRVLSDRYDAVLIDAADVAGFDEAPRAAAFAHAVVLVAQAGETDRASLKTAHKRLAAHGDGSIGVVLNGRTGPAPARLNRALAEAPSRAPRPQPMGGAV